jgi:hypothetical protein
MICKVCPEGGHTSTLKRQRDGACGQIMLHTYPFVILMGLLSRLNNAASATKRSDA